MAKMLSIFAENVIRKNVKGIIMKTNKTVEALKQVMESIDESKESLFVIHYDWEKHQLAMSMGGEKTLPVAMVASALQEVPNNDPAACTLLRGFAVADFLMEGKLKRLLNGLGKELKSKAEKEISNGFGYKSTTTS